MYHCQATKAKRKPQKAIVLFADRRTNGALCLTYKDKNWIITRFRPTWGESTFSCCSYTDHFVSRIAYL